MYKCKECGAEYKEKPDYCECGNDEFELIEETVPAPANKKIPNNESAASQEQKEVKKVLSASDMNFHNKTKTDIPRSSLNIDALSLAIFGICILLSFYVIFFAWNPKESDGTFAAKPTEQSTQTVKNIPSIDKIWNNTPPKRVNSEPKPVVQAPVQTAPQNNIKVIPVQPVVKPQPVKTVTPKVTKVPLKKSPTMAKNIYASKKAIIKEASAQNKQINSQEAARKKAEAAAKQKLAAEQKAAEAAQLKKLQAEQAKKAAAQRAAQSAASKREYVNYKAQLRNTIGRKIDFTRVIGDGSCTVAFRIDSSGKLINRSFAKQSSNNTLNDAVYKAVMATPSFNPPPAAYKNEMLNLNIRFTNGNFEISLP